MVNYSYYNTVYGGERITEGQQFIRLKGKAERLVHRRSFGRIDLPMTVDISDMVKLTICELMDELSYVESVGNIKSKKSGDFFDETYDTDRGDYRRSMDSIILYNLGETGLLYRGR